MRKSEGMARQHHGNQTRDGDGRREEDTTAGQIAREMQTNCNRDLILLLTVHEQVEITRTQGRTTADSTPTDKKRRDD